MLELLALSVEKPISDWWDVVFYGLLAGLGFAVIVGLAVVLSSLAGRNNHRDHHE